MIRFAAELWAILAVCFLAGGLVGWLLSRFIRPLFARYAPAGAGEDDDDWDDAEDLVPLPELVPIPAPAARRDEASVTIDAAPLRTRRAEPVPARSASASTAPASSAPASSAPASSAPANPAPPRPAMSKPLPPRLRPPAVPGPRHGKADALQRLPGLSRRHADRLYAIGIYHFSQIAAWTPQEIAWVADYLDLGDAIRDEDWVGKAARLAAIEPGRRPRT